MVDSLDVSCYFKTGVIKRRSYICDDCMGEDAAVFAFLLGDLGLLARVVHVAVVSRSSSSSSSSSSSRPYMGMKEGREGFGDESDVGEGE
eukprot:evm.model.NODE_32075_length_13172_cov_23.964926.4